MKIKEQLKKLVEANQKKIERLTPTNVKTADQK